MWTNKNYQVEDRRKSAPEKVRSGKSPIWKKSGPGNVRSGNVRSGKVRSGKSPLRKRSAPEKVRSGERPVQKKTAPKKVHAGESPFQKKDLFHNLFRNLFRSLHIFFKTTHKPFLTTTYVPRQDVFQIRSTSTFLFARPSWA